MKGFSKTRFPNLIRHEASGNYYARVRLGQGREITRSLKTEVESVARLRLGKTLALERAAAGRLRGGNLTLGECAALYLSGIAGNKDLKPKARKYRTETVEAIRAGWTRAEAGGQMPEVRGRDFDGTRAATVTPEMAKGWWERVKRRYSPSRANGMLQSLRGILQEAVGSGSLESNPVSAQDRNFKPVAVVQGEFVMYSFAQMDLLFAELKRQRSLAYWFCRFLYHFSLRVDTARQLTLAMVNRARKQFVIPGELVKGGKFNTLVYAPIFPEMSCLLDELDGEFGVERQWVLPIKGCLRPLARACRRLNLPVLDHHAFRHIFTSHALEKGIDPRTLAGWRHDSDGGAFLLKHYSHLIDAYSAEKAAKLFFRNGPEERIHVLAANDGQ